MQEPIVTLTAELTAQQAWALAQLLKRIGFIDCRSLAVDDEEAYLMLDAIACMQRDLAELGYAPR